MKLITTILFTLLIASCASKPIIKPQPGKALLVEGDSPAEPLLIAYQVRFLSIDNKDLKTETGYPSFVHVEPGTHDVMVSCFSPSPRNPVTSNGKKSFKKNYKANKTYSFTMAEVALGTCHLYMKQLK